MPESEGANVASLAPEGEPSEHELGPAEATDPQGQLEYGLLLQAEQQARKELAMARLNWHLSKAGVPEMPHLEQLVKHLRAAELQLEVILGLKDGGGMSGPSDLEVPGGGVVLPFEKPLKRRHKEQLAQDDGDELA